MFLRLILLCGILISSLVIANPEDPAKKDQMKSEIDKCFQSPLYETYLISFDENHPQAYMMAMGEELSENGMQIESVNVGGYRALVRLTQPPAATEYLKQLIDKGEIIEINCNLKEQE